MNDLVQPPFATMLCRQRRGKSAGMLRAFQAYHDVEYLTLLNEHGFGDIEILPGLSLDDPQKGLMAIVARK